MGCGCNSPVVLSAPAAARTDVEGSLLCDVLADGTVAAQALVEAVYDQSTGLRVGTRTVDPVTGADYHVAGTLQPCPSPEQCSCQTVLLCHVPVADADPVPFLRHLCRTCTGTATVTSTTLDGTTAYDTAAGTVGPCGQETTGRQVIERCGCDDADGDGIGEVRYVELWSVNTSDPDDAPLLLGAWQDGDFTTPYEPVSPVDCPAAGPEEVAAPLVLGRICYDDGTSVRTAAVVRCAGCDDTTVRYVDVETGTEVTAPAVVPCPGAAGDPAPVCYTTGGPADPVACDTVTTTAAPGPVITSAVAVANPQAWPMLQSDLDDTWDGSPARGEGPPASRGVITCGNFDGDTGVVIEYSFATPADRVTAVNLWNAFGVNINDHDGIGSATVTLLNASGNTLYSGALNACEPVDEDTPCVTDLGGRIDGIATLRLSNLAKVPQSVDASINMGWREIGLAASYEALLTLDCGGQQVTATIEGATPGLTYAGGQLTQTAGPHTLTWHAPAGYAGTITTDTPGAFDRLDFTGGTVVTVTGDATVSFAVQVSPPASGTGGVAAGYATWDPVTGAPTVRDANTGQVVASAVIVPCPGDAGCASPTTPVTSVGLCLADGTPIAVTIIRDCAGAVTSEGWLNLATGAWTAGAVPAGTVACGDSRSIQVSGTFCAVDAGGEVVGLVLVEYTYDDTGAIADVRLVDAVTGTTYVPPAGVTVTTCPTGTEQPEQDAVVLCHTATDGTITTFVRDYRRDETGTITAHSDYLLDGTAYTPDPTGIVGVCQPGICTGCETLVLCDVPTTAPVRITGTAASGTLSNGVSWTSTSPTNATYAPIRNNADGSWWGMPSFPLATTTPTKWTFSRPSFAEFSVYVAYNATQPALNHAQLPAGLETVSLPTGYAYDPATGVLTRTSDGDPADPCSYTTDPQVIGSARFRTTSAVTTLIVGPAPNSRVARCGIFFTYWAGAVSVVPGGPFLRHLCRSCDGTPTVTDTFLDGVTPYLPAGNVGQCQTGASSTEPDPCHNTTPVLLCAAPAGSSTGVTPAITDSTVAAVGQTQFQNHPGPYTPLWTGGTLVYPAGAGPTQEHLAATGQLTADAAGCEDAAGTLTISVRVRNDGPAEGQAWDGALRLFRGTTQIAADNALEWAPVGWQGTLTVSAPVTAAEVAAGDIRVALMLETYHLGAKQWTADQFTASLELEGCALTAPVQILRNVVTDCETGEVVTTYDTTLDGEPYDIGTGEVSQCQPVTQPQEPTCCPTSEAVSLCHTAVDGTVAEFVRDYHRDATGIVTGYSDYTLDGADFVADPAGTVGQCRPVDCTSTPLCVRPSGTVEFISNAENRTTGDVDSVWKWSSMSLAGPWYDMYQVGIYPGWTVTDAGTPGGTAHWVALHPNSTVTSTGLPGEGPTLTAANPEWYARASFELPSFADPATIKIASTVLNADQLAVEWRLNAGPWQAVGRNHQPPAYTFGPAAVPGAQAGTNTIYLHGRETVFGSGASGVMMHLIVTYDVDASAYEQWLRTTCSDGSISYLDADGNPQTGIPATSTIVPCPGGTGGDGFDVETWPLCVLDSTGAVVQQVRAEQVYDTAGVATGAPRLVDAVTGDAATIPAGGSVTVCPTSTTASGRQLVERCGCSDEDGDGIAETRYVELWSVDPEGVGTPLLVGTYVDGDFTMPLTPAAPMDCLADSSGITANPVLTGLIRATDVNPRNLSTDYPGLQSVTLSVIAGNVDVTGSAFGAAVPAGASLTWSALDGDSGPLAGWSCTGQSGADYLLAWTYTA